MRRLIIDNKVITEPIINILKQLKLENTWGALKDIRDKGDNVMITCPYHKDGKESHPSCSVYCGDDESIDYGVVHCFTCGTSVPLYTMIGDVLEGDDETGKEWLIDRFGNTFIKYAEYLPDIDEGENENKYLDEKVLLKYAYFHPYMFQRKLTKEVINEFKIGYNKENNTIVFPVWDESGNLVMTTERSVDTKKFYIPENVDKPVYLLNYIKQKGITKVYVCESQINALTLWSWGYPAIALFGTGSKHQYDILKRSGIRNYILCLDGDEAGRKGTERFIFNLNRGALIGVKKIPKGKDVNDLSKEEFDSLEVEDR